MTLLNDASLAKKFDTRVLERNVARGLAKAEEYEKFVKELPDDSANAEFISEENLVEDSKS